MARAPGGLRYMATLSEDVLPADPRRYPPARHQTQAAPRALLAAAGCGQRWVEGSVRAADSLAVSVQDVWEVLW